MKKSKKSMTALEVEKEWLKALHSSKMSDIDKAILILERVKKLFVLTK